MTESEGMGVEHSLHDRMKGGKKMSKISQSACTHLKYPYTENRVTKPGEQINFSREKQGLHRTTQLFTLHSPPYSHYQALTAVGKRSRFTRSTFLWGT